MQRLILFVVAALLALTAPALAQSTDQGAGGPSQGQNQGNANGAPTDDGLSALAQEPPPPLIDPLTGLLIGGLAFGGGLTAIIITTQNNNNSSPPASP